MVAQWAPRVVSFLGQFASFILGLSNKPDINAALRPVIQSMAALNEYYNAFFTAIIGGLSDQTQGWGRASVANERFATNMEAAFSGIKLAIDLLVSDTIPASLHYLEGRIVSQHIGPVGAKIADLNSRVGGRGAKGSGSLFGWRNSVVDPTIRSYRDLAGQWVRFNGWFGGPDHWKPLPWGKGADWIVGLANAWANPSSYMDLLFTRRAQNAGGPFSVAVSWLADGAHQGALDDLLQLLIDNSGDRYRHIIKAGEFILNQEYDPANA